MPDAILCQAFFIITQFSLRVLILTKMNGIHRFISFLLGFNKIKFYFCPSKPKLYFLDFNFF